MDSCDAGYTGDPSVIELICQDTGDWTDVSGCTILGKSAVVDFYVNFIL